jgi:hypothetical protein
VRASDAGLDGAVAKIAKRCCSQVRTCATSKEALVTASIAPVADFAGYVLPPLKKSNRHHLVLGSLVVLLCHAKMVLRLSWRSVAVEFGVLSVVATRHGPGCLAANMSHSICIGFLCGPLNSRVDYAIEHATAVFAGWVAWRRACNLRKVDSTHAA